MEAVPWPQVGVAGLGWFIAGMCLWGLFTGRFVTRREADLAADRIQAQDKIIAELTHQNGMLLNSAIPTVDAVLNALHEAADVGGSR